MGETFVGIVAQCFGGKWGERKSYTEVVMKLCLAQFIEYLIRAKIIHRMADFPRWSDLKHFNNVTTTHFTDGQAFYDILKVCACFFAKLASR